MSNLNHIINIQLNNKNLEEIASSVGIDVELLKVLLKDRYFGFVSETNPIEPKKFLQILCSFTDMKEMKINNRIDMFLRGLNSFRSSLPYIFVDTNFVRENQSIFVLALFENHRNFKIRADVDISEIIKEHFKKTGGELEMWGKIDKYVYHDLKDEVTVYDVDGNQIEADNVNETRATLSLR